MELREVLDDVLAATPVPTDVEVVLDVDSVALQADSNQLAQILTNLIDNAYQAMPEGGSLCIGAHADTDTVIITVEDTGGGIDLTLVDRFFEPFFTTRSDGTGLGLAIVRRLTEGHGGQIAIENGKLGGAIVTLRITSRTFERACMALDTKPRLFVTYAPMERITMSEYEDDAGVGPTKLVPSGSSHRAGSLPGEMDRGPGADPVSASRAAKRERAGCARGRRRRRCPLDGGGSLAVGWVQCCRGRGR